jgi:hypothetical protein
MDLPPLQGELGADQGVQQKEDDQVCVQLGVQPPGLLHGHDYCHFKLSSTQNKLYII